MWKDVLGSVVLLCYVDLVDVMVYFGGNGGE